MKYKSTPDCFNCPNEKCSLLGFCTPEGIQFINKVKIYEFFKKGQQILFEKSFVHGVYFILEGKVKVYKTGVNGKDQIVRLAGPGDILGHRGINQKTFPISSSALEDTHLCLIEIKDFLKILQTNHGLTYQLLLFFADELNYSESRVRDLAQLSVREKIADSLIRIKVVFNPRAETDSIGVVMSRKDISDFAGTTKEQVSKNLSDFAHEGLIEFNGKEIRIINQNQLQMIAGSLSERIKK